MNNDNFNFWKMTFDMGAIDISILRQAVKTDSNPFGEITKDEFKKITGVDFEVKETTPVEPQSDTQEKIVTPATEVTPGQSQEQPQQATQ